MGKRLNLAGVFESSAKDGLSIDDVFFRAIVNCVDFNSKKGEPLAGVNMARNRVYSAQTALEKHQSLVNRDKRQEESILFLNESVHS